MHLERNRNRLIDRLLKPESKIKENTTKLTLIKNTKELTEIKNNKDGTIILEKYKKKLKEMINGLQSYPKQDIASIKSTLSDFKSAIEKLYSDIDKETATIKFIADIKDHQNQLSEDSDKIAIKNAKIKILENKENKDTKSIIHPQKEHIIQLSHDKS